MHDEGGSIIRGGAPALRRPSDDRWAAGANRRRLPAAAVWLPIALLAFVARLLPTLHGGGLGGLDDYDDGVYFAGSQALIAGRLPYRDFLLLHPPGILLVLSPLAASAHRHFVAHRPVHRRARTGGCCRPRPCGCPSRCSRSWRGCCPRCTA